MEIKLETHTGEQDTPAGKITIDHPIWRVYVVDASLKGPPCNSPTGYLQVGYIGKQRRGQFLPHQFVLPLRGQAASIQRGRGQAAAWFSEHHAGGRRATAIAGRG